MKPIFTSLLLSAAIMTNSTANESLNSPTLISVKSNHSVSTTADRFEKLAQQKGLTLFARINHSENASSVEMNLPPTEVILFGNPLVGTKLMQCSATVAIDLPQKLLVWQDSDGNTQIAYNDPLHLKQRHDIVGCDEALNKVSGLLAKLTEAAAQ